MPTDEQLIEQLRAALRADQRDPPQDLLDRIHRELALDAHASASRWRRRLPRSGGATDGGSRLGRGVRSARRRVTLGGVVSTAAVVIAVAVAIGAVVLLGSHHGHGITRRPARGRDLPASVSAAQVAAPVSLRALPVARYCDAAAAGYPQLVPCRPGLKPLAHPGRKPFSARPERLVQLTFIARRAAVVDSWYAFDLTAPRACPGDSQSGPTYSPVRAGARLRFDFLLPPDCRGTISADVAYWTIAPHAQIERSVLVGRSTLRTP